MDSFFEGFSWLCFRSRFFCIGDSPEALSDKVTLIVSQKGWQTDKHIKVWRMLQSLMYSSVSILLELSYSMRLHNIRANPCSAGMLHALVQAIFPHTSVLSIGALILVVFACAIFALSVTPGALLEPAGHTQGVVGQIEGIGWSYSRSSLDRFQSLAGHT